ncbi:HGxxPAAW family protein [Microbacterium karelineae]|uniref:HGxxPAAW family protein n=1 Tax=Microbacterium karelineae TaxID=2654283 RepID=UPI0012EA2B04|nr:HGxxPAAW family protein [Microbacterium karelineae]
MSNPIGDPGHGHSPAAWTSVIIMLIAISIGTAALFFDVMWLLVAGAVLLVIGAIVGGIMSKAGLGANGSKHQSKAH